MTTATVTVVFTDMVGSTGLLTRVDPSVAESIRGELFDLQRAAVSQHGGTEVKTMGDGMLATFTSAAEAVEAAVAAQQRIDARNRRAEHPIRIRIGISTGEVETDGDDVFGTPVVEASRLCDRADPDGILLAAIVRLVAGAHLDHPLEPVGTLRLKGLESPVDACSVAWAPLRGESVTGVPFPARLARHASAPFVGRREETARLADLCDRSDTASQRCLAVVAGEPGIGKTTLVGRAAATAHDGGAIVAFGRCDLAGTAPFGPWREALGELAEHGAVDPDAVAALLDIGGPAAGDGEAARHALYRAVTAELDRAAREAPIIVVLDDLHWADAPSIRLLREVVSAPTPSRLMVMGTFRDRETPADHPLTAAIGALHREIEVHRLDLDGLDDSDVVDLFEAIVGRRADDAGRTVSGALRAETRGNPFFAIELLRHLDETGAIESALDTDGRAASIVDHGMPERVREVLAQRIASVPEDAQTALRTAAVLGQSFDLEVLARILDQRPDRLLDVLEPAEERGLIVATGPDTFTFAHALIARALYEALSPVRRARTHRAAGEALTALAGTGTGPHSASLALHWEAAALPDPAPAIAAARRAGDHAMTRLAPEEALRWYRRCLAEVRDAGEGHEVEEGRALAGLGEAQRQLGLSEYRATLVRAGARARAVGDDEALIHAALATNRGALTTSMGNVADDVIDLIATAARAVEGEGSIREARLLVCLAIEHAGVDVEQAFEVAARSVEIARGTGDPTTITSVCGRAAFAAWGPAHQDEARRWSAEAMARLDEVTEPLVRIEAVNQALVSSLVDADVETFDRLLPRAEALRDQMGLPYYWWTTSFHRAMRVMVTGDLERAEAASELALQRGEACEQPDAVLFYGAQLIAIRFYQGRLAELVDLVDVVADERPRLVVLDVVRSVARMEAGDLDAAREGIGPSLIRRLPRDRTWTSALALATQIAVRLDLPDEATDLYRLLLPSADLLPTTGATAFELSHASLGRLATTIGRYDEAERHFAEAERVHLAMGARHFTARTRAGWAAMLLRRDAPGDRARAEVLSRAALEDATAHGYGVVTAEAETVLAALARRPVGS